MWEEQFYELSIAAGGQQGLITTAQLSRLGIEAAALDRFTAAGLLLALDWDVYQIAGSALGPRYAYPYAAWLAISPRAFHTERPDTPADAVLSHESAADLHNLGSSSSPRVVFTVPEQREALRATTMQVARLAADEVTTRMGIPVTTPHRTIVDLVQDWTDRDVLHGVMTDAIRRDVVDLKMLYNDLAPLANEHSFPAEGPEFLRFFMPHLKPESLPPRNLRAFAALAFPDRVAEVQQRVLRVLADTGILAEPAAARDPAPEQVSRDVAAEIVGRTGIAELVASWRAAATTRGSEGDATALG